MKKIALFLSLGCFLSTTTANADLLVYEGFEGYYDKSSTQGSSSFNGKNDHLVGQSDLNGGFGWSGSWSTNLNIHQSSMSKSGLVVSQGHYVGDGTTYRNFDTSANSKLAKAGFVNGNGKVGAVGKTLWFSFLGANENMSSWGGVSFFDGSNESIYIGKGSYKWKVMPYGGTQPSTTSDVLIGKSINPDLIVMKMTFNQNSTEISFWINPDGSSNDPTGKEYKVVSSNGSPRTFDRIRFASGSGDNSIDELKIGTDYNSVTSNAVPEPATMVLLAMGGAGCLLRRKRKSA